MKSGRYSPCAAAKSAAGLGGLRFNEAHNRARGFFVRKALACLFNGGLGGEAFGLAGFFVNRSANAIQVTTIVLGGIFGGDSSLLNEEAANMATIPALTQPEITIANGHAVTSSIAVAEYFGKQHHHVVQKIENLECSAEFLTRNFSRVQFEHRGNIYNAYQMTKDGFVFLVMGFTGKKAAIFKENYISAFNTMEAQLRASASNSLATMHSNTYRIQQTFTTDGVLVCSRRMGEGELCADFETFLELARRGGYLVIREDDLLRQLRGDVKSIAKM